MKSCWIFCGAPAENFRVRPPENAYIIAADSGYSVLKRMGITPDILLGDFDSLNDEINDDCIIITSPTEKDDTDTMLAVKTALDKGCTDITLASSIGGRLDHTYANIQTLAYISRFGASGCMIGENDIVYLLNEGEHFINKIENMYFSIFAYSENATITTTGTKYNLYNYCLSNKFPLGVSNEIIENECKLTIKDGQVLVIFSQM